MESVGKYVPGSGVDFTNMTNYLRFIYEAPELLENQPRLGFLSKLHFFMMLCPTIMVERRD